MSNNKSNKSNSDKNCDEKCIYVYRKVLYNPPEDGGPHIMLHSYHAWVCNKHNIITQSPPKFAQKIDPTPIKSEPC